MPSSSYPPKHLTRLPRQNTKTHKLTRKETAAACHQLSALPLPRPKEGATHQSNKPLQVRLKIVSSGRETVKIIIRPGRVRTPCDDRLGPHDGDGAVEPAPDLKPEGHQKVDQDFRSLSPSEELAVTSSRSGRHWFVFTRNVTRQPKFTPMGNLRLDT